MSVLDSLAPPCTPGRWTHDHVTVERIESGPVTLRRNDGRLHVTHSLGPDELSERLVAGVTASIEDADFGQDEFELTMVGLVRSTVPPDRSMPGSPTTTTPLVNFSTAQRISHPSTTRPPNWSAVGYSISVLLRVPAAAAGPRRYTRDRHRHPPRNHDRSWH